MFSGWFIWGPSDDQNSLCFMRTLRIARISLGRGWKEHVVRQSKRLQLVGFGTPSINDTRARGPTSSQVDIVEFAGTLSLV